MGVVSSVVVSGGKDPAYRGAGLHVLGCPSFQVGVELGHTAGKGFPIMSALVEYCRGNHWQLGFVACGSLPESGGGLGRAEQSFGQNRTVAGG